MQWVASETRLRRERVRDLLGAVRVAYREAPSEQLRAAGEALQAALKLADSPAASLGHKASLRRFAEAAELLAGLNWTELRLDAAIQASLRAVEGEGPSRR